MHAQPSDLSVKSLATVRQASLFNFDLFAICRRNQNRIEWCSQWRSWVTIFFRPLDPTANKVLAGYKQALMLVVQKECYLRTYFLRRALMISITLLVAFVRVIAICSPIEASRLSEGIGISFREWRHFQNTRWDQHWNYQTLLWTTFIPSQLEYWLNQLRGDQLHKDS